MFVDLKNVRGFGKVHIKKKVQPFGKLFADVNIIGGFEKCWWN
jgi:hypothetical protein